VVRGSARLEADGSVHEAVELRSRPTWVELTGRAAGGAACGPAWLLLRSVPSYSQRATSAVLRLRVPTCQASLAGTVEVPAGPFFSRDFETGQVSEVDLPAFRIDRDEVTQGAYRVYAAMRALTGDDAAYAPESLTPDPLRTRMSQLDAPMAERYCQFLGKRLPSMAEWRKAGRGGLWLDAARTVRNPFPHRVTPWGDLDPRHAALAIRPPRPLLEPRLFQPVGSSPDDVSPYGVRDLMGGGTEWTRDVDPGPSHRQVILGGNDREPEVTEAQVFQLDGYNTRLPFNREFGTAVRCVSP